MNPEELPPPKPQNWIARFVIIITGFILTLLIILACIKINAEDKEYNHIKDLFGLLLPLLGTWMGTVLAYYFSKENFESANKNTNSLVQKVLSQDEKMQEIKVTDVMLTPNNFAYHKADGIDGFKNLALLPLIKTMQTLQTERLPILDKSSSKFVFLVYRSTIERFIIGHNSGEIKINGVAEGTKKAIEELTIGDMFNSDYHLFQEIISITDAGKFYLPDTAKLYEAKQMMLDNALCQDVFITKSGNKEEQVLGWITNEIIVEKAELFKRARQKQ
ncbi:MAG: hypothetical protein SFW35_02330 [Chitinophagales bacterium]|nr:hypothetical protein [Chitinophagales bacterium]